MSNKYEKANLLDNFFAPFLIPILFFVGIWVILYGFIKFSTDETDLLAIRWRISIPENVRTEELHESIGFHGDGNRIFVVDCSQSDTIGTIFDRRLYSLVMKRGGWRIIQDCYRYIADEKQISRTDLPMPSQTANIKSFFFQKDKNHLIILYDESLDRYFVYEDIF